MSNTQNIQETTYDQQNIGYAPSNTSVNQFNNINNITSNQTLINQVKSPTHHDMSGLKPSFEVTNYNQQAVSFAQSHMQSEDPLIS